MLTQVAKFELRYLLRNPLMWVTTAATFALFFIGMNVKGFELGSEGGLLQNAAYATLRNYLVCSVIFMFVTTSFVANVVIRDDETGFGPIIRSTPITKFQYLIGRYLGAVAVAALCMLMVPLGIWIGTLMPWADPASLGPNRLVDHLYGYFLIALPNVLVHSAVFFALATITRSMMATYLGVISFVSGFFILNDALRRPQLELTISMVEPFAARALQDAVRYWTIPERNALLPHFSGALLYNRLLWISVAVLCLALAYATYRFADQGMSKRERKKQKLQEGACSCGAERGRGCPVCAPSAGDPSTSLGMTRRPLPSPRHDGAALRALVWMRTKFEARQVIKSPAFVILMAWGLYITIFVLITQRFPDGRPTYPTTLSLIPKIEDTLEVVLLVVAIYYAGELVWRERDRRVHEIVDATPFPNWAYVVPKTMALALVLVSILLVEVAAAVILQLSLGYTHLELGKYLLWYVVPATWDMLILAALATFVQALSPHKVVGWGIMVLFVLWKYVNPIIDHNLFNYGEVPRVPLSDLNGAGSFWQAAWTFRVYWGALAVLLLLGAHLLWRRGTEIRLMPRLRLARRRMRGAAGWVAATALLVFLASGAYAFYNINILNEYRSPTANEAHLVAFERKYGRYRDLPQPTIADLTLDIALYPEERRAVTKGHYVLRNLTAGPIQDIHVRVADRDLKLTSVAIPGARLIQNDPEYDYRIFRLDRPMQPREERVLSFETLRWHRGFLNRYPATGMIENGTFLSNTDLMPVVAAGPGYPIEDPAKRRKYGLPEASGPRKLEDLSATMKCDLGQGWTKADITVSTSADQTPIAPGKKVLDVTRGGRRTARYVSGAPILVFFSVQSARYAEKHRRHNGIDLAVYYHPAHAWNVDHMLDAMESSFDYYQANFGPYQFDHFRIVEFPGYRYYAQAFPGTIAYSERLDFISDFTQPETIDHVTGVTAHELAHQYWAHQAVGADMEGSSILTETLAQYSMLMVMKHLHGEEHIRRLLQYALDNYLGSRAYVPADEPTLARVTGDSRHVTYQKGALAFYLLQKRMGEDAVNRALRNYLARYRFHGPPYPRSLDLIAALRAEARTPEEQSLITDLFERITFYDLKVTQPTAVRRPDGKWDVTVPIEAKKLYVGKDTTTTESPLSERIEVGLFTAEPGRDVFDAKDVLLMERHPIHSGTQVLKFITPQKPLFAGIDPYNFYIDRDSGDNVSPVG